MFLDDSDVHPRVRQRIELTERLIAGDAAGELPRGARGQTAIERVVSLVLLGDLVSIYLAALRGVDPGPVEALDELKGELANASDRPRTGRLSLAPRACATFGCGRGALRRALDPPARPPCSKGAHLTRQEESYGNDLLPPGRLQGRRPLAGRVRPQGDHAGRARDARPDGHARASTPTPSR